MIERPLGCMQFNHPAVTHLNLRDAISVKNIHRTLRLRVQLVGMTFWVREEPKLTAPKMTSHFTFHISHMNSSHTGISSASQSIHSSKPAWRHEIVAIKLIQSRQQKESPPLLAGACPHRTSALGKILAESGPLATSHPRSSRNSLM